MASFTMVVRCFWFLASLLLVVLVECDVTTTSVVRPNRKPNEGPLPNVLGLPVTISRALRRIHESTRNYRLMDDIWFEVKPENAGVDKKKSASKSPPSSLVEQADAVFDTHRLSWHNAIIQGLDLVIYKDQMQRYTFDLIRQNQDIDRNMPIQGTRTFGFQRRRLQLVMLPVMYKLGVITTLLIGLTVLSVKGVTIGVVLLMLAVASVVSKLSKHHHHAAPYAAYPWPAVHEDHAYDRASQHLQQRPDDKNIHVHVHAAPGYAPPVGGHAALRNSPSYDSQEPADDNYGPYYWNRNNGEDFYDAAAAMNNDNNYYHRSNYNNNNNNRRLGGDSDAESTTNSPYRWLG